jgi:flap endonuclease-1
MQLRAFDAVTVLRQAEKEEKAADAEDGAKKKKGGVQVPEEWPWEEAKKLFEKPDVIPASEVEV